MPAPNKPPEPITAKRDIQAHPVFTDEELDALSEAMRLFHPEKRPAFKEPGLRAWAKVMDAIIYRRKKDGPLDTAPAQGAKGAQAAVEEEVGEGGSDEP